MGISCWGKSYRVYAPTLVVTALLINLLHNSINFHLLTVRIELLLIKTLHSVFQREIQLSKLWDPLRDVSSVNIKFAVKRICFFDLIYV